ncbi:phosphatidylinositol-glycan biosynthesis class X protein isoform X2 [Toxorhynchites rutilus septentrionalis]|uniref:phosphatidylinositol-glycan biosynthesis class X protein isoform X2 n=1 Tax=Toxorhynchites rutilus septentrionalis TaxID=329112 RepID=UPI00247842F1|nr:phosphatidylinositol-glycan biosynthesis class X protein isoform X2 [Toxorhynchites rutilus septentrionalis]
MLCFLFIALIFGTVDHVLCLSSFLYMNVHNSGFHRDIHYSLKFGGIAKRSCELLLLQQLPAAMYVDVDQLNNMKKFKKINSYVPLYVDVEKPASKSSPFTVYLFGNIRREVNITLPIHFRYHDPSQKKFERIQIESPLLYIQCRGTSSKNPLKTTVTHQHPCTSSAQIYDYDKLNQAQYCEWSELEFSNVPTVISVLIPVGNSASYKFVLPATILVSWIGSMYLIYIIVKSGKRINKKLL